MSDSEVREPELEVEKSEKRLFVGGLFPEVKPEELESRFAPYGTVRGTEIKIRKDDDGKPVKTFAYIDLETSDADLRKCMNTYRRARWHGRELKVEEAKVNFLKKLEKEREEMVEKEKVNEVQLAPVSGIQNKLMAISDIATAANFNMRGATPGTRVPGQENWVVGKYGRVLPVVTLKKNGLSKLLKVDPSKLTHNVRKIKDEKEPDTVDPGKLTWQLEEDDNDITRKRKGEFPEWKPHKLKRKAYVNGTEREMDVQKRVMAVVESDRTYRISDFEVVPVLDKTGVANSIDKSGNGDLGRFDSDVEEEHVGCASNYVVDGFMDLSRFNSDSEDEISFSVQHKIQSKPSKETVIKSQEKNQKGKTIVSPFKSNRSTNKCVSKDFQKTKPTTGPLSTKTNNDKMLGIQNFIDEYSSGFVEIDTGNGYPNYVNKHSDGAASDNDDSDFEAFVKREMKKVESIKSKPNLASQNNNDKDSASMKPLHLEQSQIKNVIQSERVKPRIIEGKKTLLAFRGTKFLSANNATKRSSTNNDESTISNKQEPTVKENGSVDKKTEVVESEVVSLTNTEELASRRKLEPVRPATKSSAPTQFVKPKLLLDEFSSGFETVNTTKDDDSFDEDEDDDSDFENYVKRESNRIESQRKSLARSKNTDHTGQQKYENLEKPEKSNDEVKKCNSSSSSESDDSTSLNSVEAVCHNISIAVDNKLNHLNERNSLERHVQGISDTSESSSSSESDESDEEEGIDDDDTDSNADIEQEVDESNNSDDDVKSEVDDEDDEEEEEDSLDDESDGSSSDFETLISKAINEIREPRSSGGLSVTKDADTSKIGASENSQIITPVVVKAHSAANSCIDSDCEKGEVSESQTLKNRKRLTIGCSGDISESSDSDNDTDIESESTDNDIDIGSESTDNDNEEESDSSNDTDEDSKSEVTIKKSRETSESKRQETLTRVVDSSAVLPDCEPQRIKAVSEKSSEGQNDSVFAETTSGSHLNLIKDLTEKSQSPKFENKTGTSKAKEETKSPKLEDKAGADKKRLEAVKQRQKETKAQKSAIKNALSNLDEKKKVNTKIVFDSDAEEDQVADNKIPGNIKPSQGKDATVEHKTTKSKSLFDSDDDDDEDDDSDAGRFNVREEFEGAEGRKLAKLQSRFGNDERFRLDARFIESGSEDEEEEKIDEEDETTRSLRILQTVVGVKAVGGLHKQDKAKRKFKDIGALKYDPSREGHQQFEVKSTPTEEPKEVKKKKKKKNMEDASEEKDPEIELPEVSKERFHEISDTLKCTLAAKENVKTSSSGSGFSLLAAFGRHYSEDDEQDDIVEESAIPIPKTLRTNQLSLDNRFKVRDDVKDAENDMDVEDADDNQTGSEDKMDTTEQTTKPETVVKPSTTFFFTQKDVRLKGGGTFLNKQGTKDVKEDWLEKKRHLIASYKSKHKNLRRKKGTTHHKRGGKRR